MKSHEYNNVDNGLPITAQTVLVPRLFSISMADNPSVLCLCCGYDLTNLPLGRRSLNGTSASSVVRLWRMFAQDELSLGGFPADIVVEDLFDPVSCKMCRACFNAYTSMVKQEGKLRSKIQATLHTTVAHPASKRSREQSTAVSGGGSMNLMQSRDKTSDIPVTVSCL